MQTMQLDQVAKYLMWCCSINKEAYHDKNNAINDNKFCKLINQLLDDLRNGHRSLSISSDFSSSIFTWSCSTRTELVQKWSLLVRIRTSMERIRICFFEPGDLRFRPDSGQMEEDLDALLLYNKVELYLHRRIYNKLRANPKKI